MEDEIIRSILDECMLNKIYEGKSAKYWLKYEFHEIYIILYDDTPLINNDYHHIMFMRKTKTGNKIYEVDELFKKFYNILPIVLKEMLGVHAYCMSYEYLVLDDYGMMYLRGGLLRNPFWRLLSYQKSMTLI